MDTISAGPPVLWSLGTGLSGYSASLLPSFGLAFESAQTSLSCSPLREKQLTKGTRVSPTGSIHSHGLEVRRALLRKCMLQ